MNKDNFSPLPEGAVAIVGMAGRFPGADSVDSFWRNLCAGREGIRFFEPAELDPSIPAELREDPDYVRARGIIDDCDKFDAAFFGIPPIEAQVLDPQQRIMMELAWLALESAGHVPSRFPGLIGVYAGMNWARYHAQCVAAHPEVIARYGEFNVALANEYDFLATRISYKLGLRGPSINIATACSTSLVAVAQAAQSLLNYECDLALAGGASVTVPVMSGYLHQEGSMLSADGHCRAFDAAGTGTTFSDGAAFVALRRLEDALADGDPIVAVLRGFAVNNDGAGKVSFTAPSVEGQAEVIRAALEHAGVEPETIGLIEAHGTATPMGDPIEVAALRQVYAGAAARGARCALGSVKSAVGHLIHAAGVTGLIKAAFAVRDGRIPATLFFRTPNPRLKLEDSPFYVNSETIAWPAASHPRRAGVSSFGVGGTNAHVIVEEPPSAPPSSAPIGVQILQLSAREPGPLNRMAEHLADYLAADPGCNLADVAHTLAVGRERFPHRLAISADSPVAAVAALRDSGSAQRVQRVVGQEPPPLVWLFPGQGSQYAGMGRELYAAAPAFRAAFDECLAALEPALDFDLKSRMFGDHADLLRETGTTQPAIFCLEYALARTWQSRGATPTAMIGHSVGEFVAAVIANVISLGEAARLVACRGAMMQALPGGAMLSVRLAADALLSRLPPDLSLAAINGPTACVVAGESAAVERFARVLEAEEIPARLLQTSHAFHSAMMDAVVQPFAALARESSLRPPDIPIVSTLTGDWLKADEATDFLYWSRHLREAVRFSPAVQQVLSRHPAAAFLEMGPRAMLSTLVRQHAPRGSVPTFAIASLADSPANELQQMGLAQGGLWTAGIELPAPVASPPEGRRRVALPGYAFERTRYWLDAPPALTPAPAASSAIQILPNLPAETTNMRKTELIRKLRDLFADLSGTDMSSVSETARFVELGYDSLTLTQAAQQLKRSFGVAVKFRQLMEELATLDALATFLDAALPAAAPPPPPAVSPAQAAAVVPSSAAVAMPGLAAAPLSAAVAGGSMVQQLIQQQMQLMAQQLALLGGTAGAAVPAGPAAAPASSAAITPVVAAVATPAAPQSGSASEEAPTRVSYDAKKAFGAIARIHTQSGALDEKQRAQLEAFIRRYTDNTKASKAYTATHRPHTADPRVVNGFRPLTKEITYQIVVNRSKGSRLWDIDGNEYVNVLNGFGMNLFGWRPDFINEALHAQLDQGYEIGPQHALTGEVSKLICELTGFDRVGLCNTGSEAVMAAMRIARTVTGRDTIVLFSGSYHGTFDEVLVRAGRDHRGMPAAPGILPGMFGEVRVLDYGTPESLEFIRANAGDLAAVLVETVQSRRPDFQPREFLREVRAITEAAGTCLIFDEVITGFRSHLRGIQAVFGIRADLATYGKVIGGGMPIGAVAGKREFMDALDGGPWQYGDDSIPTVGVTYFAGTFVRHPLALAAAKASLEHLKHAGPGLQEQLNLTTAAMADELTAFCREVGAPLEIRYFASLWRVTWLEDHPLQDLLFAMMRSRGIHILDNFPCFMTTAHSMQDIALIKSAFKESVAEMQEAGFLPRRPEKIESFDAACPPVPGARLGRDADGKPAWFVANPDAPGKYMKVNVQ